MAIVHRRISTRATGASAALHDGLRLMAEAAGCRAVHGFLLGKDGRLRLKAVVPAVAAASRATDPVRSPALFEAMYAKSLRTLDPEACVAVVPEAAGATACVAVPLQGSDGPAGVAVAAFDHALRSSDVRCLAAFGEATAAAVESARAMEVLARRAHAAEQTVRRLVSGALDGSAIGFVVDLDGRVLKWSRGAARRFGWSEHEIRGARLPVPSGSSARYLADLRSNAATDASFRIAFDLERRDGVVERVDAVGTAVASHDEDASAVLLICYEPDSLTPYADSLRQAYLASLIERELASPLTAIKGYAELLARPSIAEDGAQRSRVVRALAQRAREVEQILVDLALLAGLERGNGLIVESVDLGMVVADVARRVNANHGCEVFAVHVREGARVLLDRACAERSLEGLLRCVARSSSKGETVAVTVRREGGAVEVLIDSSPSAPEAPFGEPLPYALTEAGVGFHLARMTAEAHGGDVWFEAADAGRARIGIRLPAHDGDEESAWLVPMV